MQNPIDTLTSELANAVKQQAANIALLVAAGGKGPEVNIPALVSVLAMCVAAFRDNNGLDMSEAVLSMVYESMVFEMSRSTSDVYG